METKVILTISLLGPESTVMWINNFTFKQSQHWTYCNVKDSYSYLPLIFIKNWKKHALCSTGIWLLLFLFILKFLLIYSGKSLVTFMLFTCMHAFILLPSQKSLSASECISVFFCHIADLLCSLLRLSESSVHLQWKLVQKIGHIHQGNCIYLQFSFQWFCCSERIEMWWHC